MIPETPLRDDLAAMTASVPVPITEMLISHSSPTVGSLSALPSATRPQTLRCRPRRGR